MPTLLTFEVAFTSGPSFTSAAIASTRFDAAANINGVWPNVFSFASISAPFSTRVVTEAASPEAAAIISGVVPSALAA